MTVNDIVATVKSVGSICPVGGNANLKAPRPVNGLIVLDSVSMNARYAGVGI